MDIKNFVFLNVNNIINGKSLVKIDARKSKAKKPLAEKIKNFFSYIISTTLSVSDMPEQSLDNVIQYLNDQKINLEKVKNFLSEKSANKIAKLAENDDKNFNEKAYTIKSNTNKVASFIDKKIDSMDNSIERIEEEKTRRNFDDSMIKDEEVQIDNSIKEDEEKIVDNQIKEQIEETKNAVNEITSQELTNEEENNINSIPEIEPIKTIDEIQEETEVKVEKISPVEPSALDIAKDEYKISLENLKQDYSEKFKNAIEELTLKFERSANTFNEKIIIDIENNAKKAILQALENTKKEQEEKQIIEKELDEYKTYYGQALQIVENKNNEISAKDQEIESLKAELALKSEQINNSLSKENEYKLELEKRDNQITEQNTRIKNYQAAVKFLRSEEIDLENQEPQNINEEGPVKTK